MSGSGGHWAYALGRWMWGSDGGDLSELANACLIWTRGASAVWRVWWLFFHPKSCVAGIGGGSEGAWGLERPREEGGSALTWTSHGAQVKWSRTETHSNSHRGSYRCCASRGQAGGLGEWLEDQPSANVRLLQSWFCGGMPPKNAGRPPDTFVRTSQSSLRPKKARNTHNKTPRLVTFSASPRATDPSPACMSLGPAARCCGLGKEWGPRG